MLDGVSGNNGNLGSRGPAGGSLARSLASPFAGRSEVGSSSLLCLSTVFFCLTTDPSNAVCQPQTIVLKL